MCYKHYKVVFYERMAVAEIVVTDVPGEQKTFEFKIYKNEYWPKLPEKFHNVSSENVEILIKRTTITG